MEVLFLDGPVDGQTIECADGITYRDFVRHVIIPMMSPVLQIKPSYESIATESVRYFFYEFRVGTESHWFGLTHRILPRNFDLIQHLREGYKP